MTNLDKNELAKIGVQFGNLVRKWNPKMRPYIFGKTKNKTHVLDLQKIVASCQEVGNYINSIIKKNKTILFLCTKKTTKNQQKNNEEPAKKQPYEIVKEQAIRCGMPYVVNKWKGGFLTNFGEIKKKLRELQGLNSFIQKDNFKSLIKKEQVKCEKRRAELQSVFEGVVNLRVQPDTLFIIGLNKEKTACLEAKKAKIPVIAVCNNNCNPKLVDYVIPGNDEKSESITFFASLVADAIIQAKGETKLVAENKEGNEKVE